MNNCVRSVLIVNNIQNDFVDGAIPLPNADYVVNVVNSYLKEAKYVIFTKTKKSCDDISFVSNIPRPKGKLVLPFDEVEYYGDMVTAFPEYCVNGTPGYLYHPGLKKYLHKEVYTGYDAEDIHSTYSDPELIKTLRWFAPTHVFWTGFGIYDKVFFTLKELSEFNVYLVHNLVKVYGDHAKLCDLCINHKIPVINHDEMYEKMQGEQTYEGYPTIQPLEDIKLSNEVAFGQKIQNFNIIVGDE